MSLNLLPLATATTGDATGGLMSMVLPMALIFGVMYFVMIRPQKKREKKVQEMRNQLEVGDEIVTIGGIIGIVVSVKDDTLVIETGSDRSKLRLNKWAVQTNMTPREAPVPEKPAKAEKPEKAEK